MGSGLRPEYMQLYIIAYSCFISQCIIDIINSQDQVFNGSWRRGDHVRRLSKMSKCEIAAEASRLRSIAQFAQPTEIGRIVHGHSQRQVQKIQEDTRSKDVRTLSFPLPQSLTRSNYPLAFKQVHSFSLVILSHHLNSCKRMVRVKGGSCEIACPDTSRDTSRDEATERGWKGIILGCGTPMSRWHGHWKPQCLFCLQTDSSRLSLNFGQLNGLVWGMCTPFCILFKRQYNELLRGNKPFMPAIGRRQKKRILIRVHQMRTTEKWVGAFRLNLQEGFIVNFINLAWHVLKRFWSSQFSKREHTMPYDTIAAMTHITQTSQN